MVNFSVALDPLSLHYETIFEKKTTYVLFSISTSYYVGNERKEKGLEYNKNMNIDFVYFWACFNISLV